MILPGARLSSPHDGGVRNPKPATVIRMTFGVVCCEYIFVQLMEPGNEKVGMKQDLVALRSELADPILKAQSTFQSKNNYFLCTTRAVFQRDETTINSRASKRTDLEEPGLFPDLITQSWCHIRWIHPTCPCSSRVIDTSPLGSVGSCSFFDPRKRRVLRTKTLAANRVGNADNGIEC
jgi:hypothetical protein